MNRKKDWTKIRYCVGKGKQTKRGVLTVNHAWNGPLFHGLALQALTAALRKHSLRGWHLIGYVRLDVPKAATRRPANRAVTR